MILWIGSWLFVGFIFLAFVNIYERNTTRDFDIGDLFNNYPLILIGPFWLIVFFVYFMRGLVIIKGKEKQK